MFCPKCGSPQPDSNQFCNQCGAPLPSRPAQPAPPPPEPEPPRRKYGIGPAVAAVLVFAVLAAILAVVLLSPRDEKDSARDPVSSAAASSDAAAASQSAAQPAAGDAADLEDYLGDWHVTDYDGETAGIVFTITRAGTHYYIEASAFFRSGNRLNGFAAVPLTLEDHTATASYDADNRGNHGQITLRLRDDSIRATVTAEGGDWGIELDRSRLERGLYDTASAPAEEIPDTPAASAASSEEDAVYAAFEAYLYGWLDAVNHGDNRGLAAAMVPDSPISSQQLTLARDLYGKGTRETVESTEIEECTRISDTRWHLRMYEAILVIKSDGSEKLAEQHFTYVVDRQADGSWLLSDMF